MIIQCKHQRGDWTIVALPWSRKKTNQQLLTEISTMEKQMNTPKWYDKKSTFRYLSDIFQISFRYLSDIFQISFRYLSDIFQISFSDLSVIFQISFRYLSDIFQISFRYLSDIKKSTFRYLSDHSSHFEDVSDVSSFSKLGAQFWNMTYIWRGIPVVFSCLTEWSWSATFGQTLSAFGGVLPFSDKPKSALNLTQWKCVLHGSFGYLFLRSRVLNSEN